MKYLLLILALAFSLLINYLLASLGHPEAMWLMDLLGIEY
jgi:hypothetical protein